MQFRKSKINGSEITLIRWVPNELKPIWDRIPEHQRLRKLERPVAGLCYGTCALLTDLIAKSPNDSALAIIEQFINFLRNQKNTDHILDLQAYNNIVPYVLSDVVLRSYKTNTVIKGDNPDAAESNLFKKRIINDKRIKRIRRVLMEYRLTLTHLFNEKRFLMSKMASRFNDLIDPSGSAFEWIAITPANVAEHVVTPSQLATKNTSEILFYDINFGFVVVNKLDFINLTTFLDTLVADLYRGPANFNPSSTSAIGMIWEPSR